jgi:hypothetical protein
MARRFPIVASVEVFDNAGIDAGETGIYEDITNYPGSRSSYNETLE